VVCNTLNESKYELKRNFHQNHFDKFLVVIPQDPWYGGEMIPVDFKQLKFNQQYKYHIRSLLAGHSHYSSLNIQGATGLPGTVPTTSEANPSFYLPIGIHISGFVLATLI